jgi:hypothetical protein
MLVYILLASKVIRLGILRTLSIPPRNLQYYMDPIYHHIGETYKLGHVHGSIDATIHLFEKPPNKNLRKCDSNCDSNVNIFLT